MNHRWKDDVCIKCGIKRKKHYSKLLMAITDFPPYNHYLREMIWLFSFDGGKWTSCRQDCVLNKHTKAITESAHFANTMLSEVCRKEETSNIGVIPADSSETWLVEQNLDKLKPEE